MAGRQLCRGNPMAAVAALPDEAEICGCNGVCKGKITGAIGTLSLKTLDDVLAHTKASASCGSCTGLVEQLMKVTLGDAYNPAAVQPMCPCTHLGHDDVRRLIVAKALKSIPTLMQALESQQFAQKDPWAERAQGGKEAHEFAPLADLTMKEAAE